MSYLSDLAKLRQEQRARFEEQRRPKPASSSDVKKTVRESTRPVRDPINAKVVSNEKQAVVKNPRIVSLALRAQHTVSSALGVLSNALLGNTSEKDDTDLIKKLKEKEVQSSQSRKLKQKLKKASNIDKMNVIAQARASKVEEEEPMAGTTSLFSFVEKPTDEVTLPTHKHISSHVFGQAFRIMNEDLSSLLGSLRDPILLRNFGRRLRKNSGQMSREQRKNRLIKMSCFTSIQKHFKNRLHLLTKEILKNAWESLEGKLDLRYCYDKVPSSSQYNFYVVLDTPESSPLTLCFRIQREIVPMVISQSQRLVKESPTTPEESSENIQRDTNRVSLTREKGQLFLQSLTGFTQKTQIVILLRAGEAAFAVFEEGLPIFSKVIKKYVTRKAQGYVQVKNDGAMQGAGRCKVYQKSHEKKETKSVSFEDLGEETLESELQTSAIRYSQKKSKSVGRLSKACKSVGSQLRREQFMEFIKATQGLLASEAWMDHVRASTVIWIASSNPTLRDTILHTPHRPEYRLVVTNSQDTTACILPDDPRVHKVPISTHRPSFTEACRCFIELNSVQVCLSGG